MFNLALAALLASSALSACNQVPVPVVPANKVDAVSPASETTSEPLESGPDTVDGWTLTGAQLVIHVGKSGALARVGHNHLISTSDLDGCAVITESGTLRATVRVQVADLTVDSQALRKSYEEKDGGQSRWAKAYLSTPSDKNITDTRANMLGERVLDAQNYPEIVVSVDAPDAEAEFDATSAGNLNINLRLAVKDVEAQASAILHWQKKENGDVAWHSSFETTHEALGMTPFSALGGALRVAENLVIDVSGVLSDG